MAELPEKTRVEGKTPSARRFTHINGVLLISTVLAISFCVIIGYQNRILVRRLSTLRTNLAGSVRALPGDIVPPFTALDLHGTFHSISYSNHAHYRIIFFFAPNCEVCERQASYWWPRIHQEICSRHIELIAVSLGDAIRTKKLMNRNHLDFDVLIMPDRPVRRAYRVTDIPVILVVSPKGRIEWAYYGLLDEQSYSELTQVVSSHVVPGIR